MEKEGNQAAASGFSDISSDARVDGAENGDSPFSIQEDFVLSEEKIEKYYLAVHHVLTNLFGKRVVLAYVTAPEKTSKSRRLFFSTILPERLGMFYAWQEATQIQQMNHSLLPFLLLFLYRFRWKIEVSY